MARPDFVDVSLRIVLEADSFEWHGGRAQLSADARRYDLLVVNGWLVLRFSYEHVMGQPEFVHRVLVAAVDLARMLNEAQRAMGSAAWRGSEKEASFSAGAEVRRGALAGEVRAAARGRP